MADTARGKIVMTPVVTIAADDDANSVDAIHHDIKGSLGGKLEYTKVEHGDKWFYAPNVIVTDTAEELFADNTNATDLVGASGDQSNGPNEAIGATLETTDGTAVDTDVDVLRFLFIKNTGTSDINNTSTTNSVYVCLDGSTPSHTSKCIEIASGEAWMSRINIKVDQIHIITGRSRAAGTSATVNGSTSVRCTVVAIIDDGG